MAPDRRDDREGAIRAMLVDRVERTRPTAWPDATGHASDRRRAGLATAIVLVVVVALSFFAIRVGGGLTGAPTGADGPVGAPTSGSIPVPTQPPGVELGRWSSEDGPVQTHVIHPSGMALASSFECRGDGPYSLSLSHDSGFSGDRTCTGGNSGVGTKGHQGDVTIRVTTTSNMRWTLIVSGIPETYVTPQPVETPLGSDGSAVPFCTDEALKASFEQVRMPEGVTREHGGQLRFENVSASTCALAGYPMVRFVDGSGAVLGDHTMDHTDERSSMEKGLRPVVLQRGGVAYSQVSWYLPDYYTENEEGPCVERTVRLLRIDLGNRLAGAAQTGSMVVPIGVATACLNGAHGVEGEYGQLSSTVFVDYSLKEAG